VRNLNPSCTEVELIYEINQIFKYNLTYRNELLKGDKKQMEREQAKSKDKKMKPYQKPDLYQYFVLGCLIIKNRQTLQSKRIAFIDFDCADAAQVMIKGWN
jgi:RNA recognition motif-containing protein